MSYPLYEPWPALPFDQFKSTAHLLHMASQMIGKLKLHTPFEPHWGNVCLWLTSRGLTTGIIPYKKGTFSIEIDLLNHQVIGMTSWNESINFPLASMSVSEFYHYFFSLLKNLHIDLSINLMPQEISNPISFDKDITPCYYDKKLANAWWRILLSSYHVMQRYHARFNGETPAIGLMWGTLDLRDVRFNGQSVSATGVNAGYIRRNAMDEAQIELGWWHGNDLYPRPAYYAFTYPQPIDIENARIEPKGAYWEKTLGEFILDYDILRALQNPEVHLLRFFESCYETGAKLARWNPALVTTGEPV